MEGGIHMNKLFDEKGHISKGSLLALKTGTLAETELISAAVHIGKCEGCANALANIFDTDELLEIPSGFVEEVTNKLQTKKRNDKQLIFYSFRVAVAACITLAIVFSGALNFITNIDVKAAEIKPSEFKVVNSINSSLRDFSQKILNMEVLENEEKKK
jgi:hypothetical protein